MIETEWSLEWELMTRVAGLLYQLLPFPSVLKRILVAVTLNFQNSFSVTHHLLCVCVLMVSEPTFYFRTTSYSMANSPSDLEVVMPGDSFKHHGKVIDSDVNPGLANCGAEIKSLFLVQPCVHYMAGPL